MVILPNYEEGIIKNSIPHAVNVGDSIAVPHKVTETRILNNLNYEVPSPIYFYYDWPNSKGYTPYESQVETAAFLTKHRNGFVLNEIGCVDSETEYLSPTGWKKISEYEGGKVAQYNLDGTTELVEPEEYIKKPCEDMIRVKTKYGLDQLLSPEHRVLYADANSNPKVISAEKMLYRDTVAKRGWKGRFYTTFTPKITTSIPLSDDELRVQVMLIADGSFPNNSNSCVVSVKKERKKARIRHLLNKANIAHKEKELDCESKKGYSRFSFKAPLIKKCFDEYFWGSSLEQLKIISDEVMHWDSSSRKAGACSFSTFIEDSANFIQYAFAATGKTASFLKSVRFRRGKAETEYIVHARKNAKLLYSCGYGENGKISNIYYEKSTNGFKYCFMVPSTFLLLRRNGCIFATGNTGKTISSLWASDFMMAQGDANKVLIVSPLSTLARVWGDEIWLNFKNRKFEILHGTKKKRLDKLKNDVDFYIINPDGTKVIWEELAARKDIDHIIFDEVAELRTAKTDKYKVIEALVKSGKTIWGLTGTPTPNNPTDAWAQVKLINPANVPKYFNRFRMETMNQVSTYKWIPKPDALEKVHKAMQPAIRYTRDECYDLPEATYVDLEVELSKEQQDAYKQMRDTLVTEYNNGEIQAANEGVKMSKLIQIAGGMVYDSNGVAQELPCKKRIDELKSNIRNAGTKVIVFVPFTNMTAMIDREISKDWTTAVVNGSVSAKNRGDIFTAFQSTKDPHVLIAHPKCMSHGLTLTEAATIIWYAPYANSEVYTQANGRITRSPQKNNQFFIHLQGTEIERRVYKKLRDNQSLQGTLLSMFES